MAPKLLSPKSWLPGYDIRTCAFWTREADMCAQYHAKRTRMGIPEPTRLDPLCGAEALAACLQHLQDPFDKATVLRVCRVTGEGSNLQDVINAGKKLGVVVRPLTANDEGLMELPKPLVCHVEHDHFIAVTAADKTGVTYLCGDCGCWPGGKIHLSWKQWHALNADAYGTVTKRGTSTDHWLTDVLSGKRPRILLAQAGGGGPVGAATPPGHHAIIRFLLFAAAWQTCEYYPQGVEFCFVCTLAEDGINLGNAGFAGAMHGDPVNLATGEEEYTPDPDLTVYNPRGPSVTWSRIYDSYRSQNRDFSAFGWSWSHSYNLSVVLTTGGGGTPSFVSGQVVMPNHGKVAFLVPVDSSGHPQQPNAGSPRLACNVQPGFPLLVEWDYDGVDTRGTFVVTFKDRSRWIVPIRDSGAELYGGCPVTQIVDRNGNAINLLYSPSERVLTSITDSDNRPLLTITRSNVGGLISSVSDCYGRSVYYGTTPNPGEPAFSLFGQVSQIVATGTPDPPTRYTYGYTAVRSPDIPLVPFLHTITVPSPKNDSSTSTATINMNTSMGAVQPPAMPFPSVTSLQDGNGNTRTYTQTMANGVAVGGTTVTVRDANENVVNTFSKGYDNHADETDHQNGEGTYTSTREYADGNDPHAPSRITDGLHAGQDAKALQGTSQSFVGAGRDSPSPRLWDVAMGGQIVASSVNAAGWSVSAAAGSGYPGGGPGRYSFTVSAPAGATVGTYYEVRYVTGTQNQPPISTFFDVIAPGGTGTTTNPTVKQGQSSTFGTNGVDAPASPLWDVVQFNGGTPSILASADSPTGWTVAVTNNGGVNNFEVGIPAGAATGGYEVRYLVPQTVYLSAFPVSASFTITGPGTNSDGVTTLTWTAQGNPKTVTTARGITTTYTYGLDDYTPEELIMVKVDGKAPTTITYNEPSGLPRTITTPRPGSANGTDTVTTSLTYDALGDVLSMTRPGNNSTSTIKTTFNYTTDPALADDPPNHVTGGMFNQIEALGQPLSVTDNLGHSTHFRYDARGNRTVSVDALGNRNDAAFNIADQTLTSTAPPTGQTGSGRSYSLNEYQYPGGPLTDTKLYDEAGSLSRQVNLHYGAEGELLSRSGSTEPVSYAYDAEYRLLYLTDGNNNQTFYQYDSATGYLNYVQYPGGDKTQFTGYNANGEVTQRTDGNGAVTNYLYTDPESKLTDIQYAASPTLNVQLHYDSYGRRDSMTDGSGSHVYTYDDLNVPLTVQTGYTGLSTQTVSYAYYRNGSRKSMTTPAGMFTYGYDGAGRPNALINPCGYTSGWSYQNNNWLQQQKLGNGATANYQYNARGLLSDLQNLNPTQTLLSEYGGTNGMQYDAAGNRTSMTANVTGVAAASGTNTYNYGQTDTNDPLHPTTAYHQNELTGEISTRGSGYGHSFGYDLAFNPTTFNGQSNAFNSNNQNTATTYDSNGNSIHYGSNQLSWDPENRMTSYGSLITDGYTGSGLRAWKQASGGPKTYFIYDRSKPVVEMNGLGQVTAVNTFGAAGLVSRTNYVNGTATANLFYTFDAQGSVSQRLDKTGVALSSSAYDAWGKKVITDGATDPWGYEAQAGYYTDQETGLILCTHRYYDPAQGRWLNRDLIGYIGGINVYGYVGNGPQNRHDALGLYAEGPNGETAMNGALISDPNDHSGGAPPGAEDEDENPGVEKWFDCLQEGVLDDYKKLVTATVAVGMSTLKIGGKIPGSRLVPGIPNAKSLEWMHEQFCPLGKARSGAMVIALFDSFMLWDEWNCANSVHF